MSNITSNSVAIAMRRALEELLSTTYIVWLYSKPWSDPRVWTCSASVLLSLFLGNHNNAMGMDKNFLLMSLSDIYSGQHIFFTYWSIRKDSFWLYISISSVRQSQNSSITIANTSFIQLTTKLMSDITSDDVVIAMKRALEELLSTT